MWGNYVVLAYVESHLGIMQGMDWEGAAEGASANVLGLQLSLTLWPA